MPFDYVPSVWNVPFPVCLANPYQFFKFHKSMDSICFLFTILYPKFKTAPDVQ